MELAGGVQKQERLRGGRGELNLDGFTNAELLLGVGGGGAGEEEETRKPSFFHE